MTPQINDNQIEYQTLIPLGHTREDIRQRKE